jgi:hypothetical protein
MPATSPWKVTRTVASPVSVSCPAKEPSFSAERDEGLQRGASSAVIDGKLTAFEMAPLSR